MCIKMNIKSITDPPKCFHDLYGIFEHEQCHFFAHLASKKCTLCYFLGILFGQYIQQIEQCQEFSNSPTGMNRHGHVIT